jgi:hypothetical protein
VHSSLCASTTISPTRVQANPKLFTRRELILTGYTGAYAFIASPTRWFSAVASLLRVRPDPGEGGVGWTRVHRPAEIVESLFDLSLEAEDFDMLFYH